MKPIYIFASRLRAFWVLVPMSIVLFLALKYNDATNHWVKLYPLIIFSIGAIIFTFVYLFRFIAISYSEIKYIGYFSSRDSAMITEGKTLILKEDKLGKVKVILFGNDGVLPGLDWMKNTYSAPKDIVLFRGNVTGGKISIKRILKFFGADKDMIASFMTDSVEFECEYTTITSVRSEEEDSIKIKINKTI